MRLQRAVVVMPALAVVLAACGGSDRDRREPLALQTPRAAHTATVLPDGTVLLAGGCATDGCSTATATTEVYDPRSDRLSPGPRLTRARDAHTATRLRDGRVALIGGYAREGTGALASAELCSRSGCRGTGSLATARGGHAAVALRDGRVLVMGGDGALATTEVCDTACTRFGPGPRLLHGRQGHTATLLPDGRVLVVGGYGRAGRAIAAAEIFDPSTARFAPAGRLRTARGKHAAVLLADGRVLVIGGSEDTETRERLASTEIYDPAAGRFTAGPALRTPRYKLPGAVALLRDGRVLVGGDSSAPEILDAAAGRSEPVARGVPAGAFATATPVGGGRTLFAGGYDDEIAISGAAFVIRAG
jgi:hypothetical protein